MKRRLFIAINLDPRIRTAIGRIARNIEESSGREYVKNISFVPPENWHITVSFLGTQDDADLVPIMQAMRATAGDFSVAEISFAEIAYVPRRDSPRMIWLTTSSDTSGSLGKIRGSLEDRLAIAGIRFEHEARPFSGHITIARFASNASVTNVPPAERSIDLHCLGTSLDLMESELTPGGAKYTVLQEFPFSEA